MKRHFLLPLLIAWRLCPLAFGQAAAEVSLDQVKPVPPAGVAIPQDQRDALQTGAAELKQQIDELTAAPSTVEVAPGIESPVLVKSTTLLPDVQIFYNAVHYALTYNEFFNVNEVDKAKTLLQEGMDRAAALKQGQAPWIHAPGLIVRGYVSRIDRSVQPYALVIPGSFATSPYTKRRLDIWYHGRGEKLSELNFLSEHRKSAGEFPPDDDTIVLHPYGRYCNGNRFAGEVDTFEALEDVRRNYAIDPDRVLVRGFSMGGAACWMMATHHAGDWCAAAPGAGYSETAGFLHLTDLSQIPWYQQKLWHWYDSVDYAGNLYNCPTVAYSGELDGQKQAADMMEKALADVGIDMVHVIGPKAHHHYTPAAKVEINRRLNAISRRGRVATPTHVKFTTWTLRYNTMAWVRIDALAQHWEKATIDAQVVDPSTVTVSAKGVVAFTLSMPPGDCPLDVARRPRVVIDGQELAADAPLSDRSWVVHFHRQGSDGSRVGQLPSAAPGAAAAAPGAAAAAPAGSWEPGELPSTALAKKHGLQGPIDDAFMDSFIFVRPTGKPLNEKVGAWAAREQAHAIEHWRKQFRGEAQVKDDAAVTDADIASSNLVLFGDPSSNAILARAIERLPIKWNEQTVALGDQQFPASSHLPVLIYPNPLNPGKYMVLNSGFTFREYDYENNARQSAKLPDWAIVDADAPATAQTPGKIKAAGFFGERWDLVAR